MLKINNNFKKYKVQLIIVLTVISGAFLFQYLTFIPDYSRAEEISTPIYDPNVSKIKTLEDLNNMSELTSQVCANTFTPSSSEKSVPSKVLNDINDVNQTYQVSKLKDGNCWMTTNMNTPDGRYKEDPVYGGYYTWQNAYNNCSKFGNEWKLPTQDDFLDLIAGISTGSILVDAPYNMLYGGRWNTTGGYIDYAGSIGYYWSATPNANNYYGLSVSSTGAPSIGWGNRINPSYGLSVRCLVSSKNISPEKPNVIIPNPNVSVTVDKILTMELSSKEVNIEPKTNEVMTGNFTATVSSNAGYDIGISAAENSPTSLVNKKDDIVIAEIPTSNNIQVGTNGWGIKCINDNDNCILKSYNALTLYNNPQVYFSSTTNATNKPTHFEVGIGISPSLPSGTYSTNILVTASQK